MNGRNLTLGIVAGLAVAGLARHRGSRATDVTSTPAFKQWFGASKVVDRSGRPVVMYHATPYAFDAFDLNKIEFGVHLGTLAAAKHTLHSRKGRVIPLYIKVENPLRMMDACFWDAPMVWSRALNAGLISDPKGIILDALIEAPESKRSMKRVRDELMKSGIDGIVYLNRREGLTEVDQRAVENHPEYDYGFENEASDEDFLEVAPSARDSFIVFEPTQIKSATDNAGTFDPADPRIHFNRRTR